MHVNVEVRIVAKILIKCNVIDIYQELPYIFVRVILSNTATNYEILEVSKEIQTLYIIILY